MQEPRFMLDKDSLCYGCPNYKHYAKSDDPDYWIQRPWDLDENGGVCDTNIPCFCGHLNNFKKED